MNAKPTPVHEHASDGEGEIDLRELIGVMMESRWWIAGIAAVFIVLGAVYALLATPVYRVNSLVQVEDDKGSALGGLQDLASLFEGKAQAVTEIELLRSRMVLGKTLDDLQLDVQVEPVYFPLIGRFIAGRNQAAEEAGEKPVIGLRSFAWGNESLSVGRFSVPRHWLNEKFVLQSLGKGSYSLEGPDGVLGKGAVGTLFDARVPGGNVQLFVRDLQGHEGVRFSLVQVDRVTVLEDLVKDLNLAEKGKLSGIIEMTYEHKDPALAVRVLNQIANNYVRQNVERKSAEAQQTLGFLDEQLPEIKKQLESAEVRFNEFRARTGTVDITKEGELLLQQSVAAETGLLELQQKRKELLSRFTPEHPSVKALDTQISALRSQQGQFAGRVDSLPKTQQELLRLTRDLQVSQELYTQLLNNAQQLKVVRAGTVGNVRVVDYAQLPIEPVKPQRKLIVALALMLGLAAGVGVAFLRHAMRNGVKDANQIESRLGLSVLATIPVSDLQHGLAKSRRKTGGSNYVLAQQSPEDLAIESLRSLRTSLHFALIDAPNNVLMITGPSPGVGKSFISVNLGCILASSGKRVLVIDADLRRGYINEYFGTARDGGLSEHIAGSLQLPEVIRQTGIDGMSYIATGTFPPNPAELLLHPRFEKMLAEVRAAYDYVIIDSPPIMAVTDAAIIGRHVGATLMAVRFAQTPLREIELANKRLEQAGVVVNGVLLNQVQAASAYGYGYKYAYAYKYSRRDET